MVKGLKSGRGGKGEAQKELVRLLEEEKLRQMQLAAESSSTITDTLSTISSLSLHEGTLEEEEIDLLDALYQTDTESIQDEEPEYVQRKSLMEEMDFFQNLGNVPDVESLSEDFSIPSETVEQPHAVAVVTKTDVGKFVNPLTGLEDGTESSSSKHEMEEEAIEDTPEISNASLEVSDISQESEVDEFEKEEEKKPDEMDDGLEAFFEFNLETAKPVVEEIDFELLAREEEARRVQENTLRFLNMLINKVVDRVEYLSPDKFLQQNLDKRKLILELADKMHFYQLNKSQCSFLNIQAVKHFRRKKSFRSIMENNEKTLQRDMLSLQNAKDHLNEMMAKETKLITLSSELQQELKEQYEQLKSEGEAAIEAFESTVTKYLRRDIWPRFNFDIDKLLSIMRRKRQEVNKVRFSLFLKQHTKARLTELIKEMEDLGNGLTMRGFTTLQAETQALDKKIEERNGDLNKLYIRCRNDIHILAHYKENQKLLHDNIIMQRKILNSLMEDKRQLRETLFGHKLQRNRIHAKMKKLSVQGGLLDKPALMFDFDETENLIEGQKKINHSLRQKFSVIQRKIDSILEYCPNEKI